ncbi:hypothetical protein GA0070609_0333 [Micromonospora echinaurantiaca]|uniref:Uncharacterized protein n=1 Tax=Micromonospora echinaurantiaca TaxID=47857 RepID=A0A1C5GSY4_9ACTN|nr:DUF6412 domain-containing protein [Micromonospora echinaurantiaca]SCG36874.1 hypothetical protein GA0070609_0333 [Micromonospora echinaurantiaca]
MPGALGLVLETWAYALAQLTLFADRPAELLAGAALVLLATLLAVRAVAGAGAPAAFGRATALRARARRRRVPRQVDPDAPGRPRPRAPGVCPSAA